MFETSPILHTKRLDLVEIEVMQRNDASEKLLLNYGFKKEGILREWMYWNGKHYDMKMFSFLKSECSKT